MRIAIIGAGIYGCHLALSLKKQGYDVDLYDMASDIFSGASTHNSFRIHKGYHYPRSGKTRAMCIEDELRFIEHYPHLLSKAKDNPKIFCVANDDRTLIDFSTMKIIMSGSGLPFERLTREELLALGFDHIEGGFKVHESILLVDRAKQWFKKKLYDTGVNLKLGICVDQIDFSHEQSVLLNNKHYRYAINCTYNQSFSYHSTRHEHYFDLCFSLIVASKKARFECQVGSFGVFDGAYPSLEPYGYESLPEQYRQYADRQLFQIFHVKHTSVKQYFDITNARTALADGLSQDLLDDLTQKILNDVCYFYPNFLEKFDVVGHDLALKTKVNDLSDVRPLMVFADVEKHPYFIQVFSSKLTSIFTAEETLLNLINDNHSKNSLVA